MKNLILLFIACASAQFLNAQGVGVGTSIPESSSMLDISSTSKGMLMPRMTTSQRDAIEDPAIGLQILNLDDMCLDIYDGTNWLKNCGMKVTGYDTVMSAAWNQIRGTVEITTDPTNTIIFTLPVSYRPSTSGHRSFVGINNNTTCRIDVLTTGDVKVVAGAIGSISLDGIEFRTD